MYTSTTNDLYDPYREIQIKIRLNQAESEALAQLTTAKGMCASEAIRQYIRKYASK
jgi:hypothetical protein